MNGSGKSTLLAILAGIARPSRGRVTGGGRTAYVPERLPSVLPFDVVGYLDRLGAVHGLPPQEARLRAAHWLERLGAAAWAHTPMATLSKGTAQKVALVQALMADADVLVLDEAWSGLDPAAGAVLDQAVNERVARGVTVVLVDHQQAGRVDPDVDVLAIEGTSVVPVSSRGTPRRGRVATSAMLTAVSGTASGAVRDTSSSTAPSVVQVPGASGAPVAGPGVVEIEFEDAAGLRVVRVPPDTSDDVLRNVLARPGHHVRSVRTLGPVSVAEPAPISAT